MITQNIHSVAAVEYGEPQEGGGSDSCPRFFWRKLRVTNRDGEQVEINLTADRPEALEIESK